MKETIGGSADLTGSNNTKTADMGVFTPEDRKGRYVYYGIREHGMAAAMNGMALHGGVRPYGGTFMCFTDYARPSMRLSALMGLPVVYVMTHDSIGLGEDGPTHQPVEHLAISRATPNTMVFRPADLVETAEAWEIALSSKRTPSVLALSRQNLPTVRTKHQGQNQVAKGAYVLADAVAKRQVVLMATGSEVEIALKARDVLEAEGIGCRVVSMPCWELFEEQEQTTAARFCPKAPCASRSKRAFALAGIAGSLAKAASARSPASSGCMTSGPLPRRIASTRSLASRQKPLLPRPKSCSVSDPI
jgi:transketolase